MPYPDHFLDKKLNERISGNFLRSLTIRQGLTDFCSNDYLGIVTNGLLNPFFRGNECHGSKGARTLAGNYSLIEETERKIADFHGSETALIFNSGYNANTGVLSSIPQRGDIILFDALSHASIRDGIRLSFAGAYSFAHNDMVDLTEKIRQHHPSEQNHLFVVTESIFSMDGDIAPIQELVKICEEYNAHLIIDEAHAIGVIGDHGEGLVQSNGLAEKVFARIFTYGKGPGAHGAAVAGSEKLITFLINFSRSFIYTTALPESAVKAIHASYDVFPKLQTERKKLDEYVQMFQNSSIPYDKLKSSTPVQGVIIPGNTEVKKVAAALLEEKLDVRPILYPSVPKGKERLRISMHAFNTKEEIELLISVFQHQ